MKCCSIPPRRHEGHEEDRKKGLGVGGRAGKEKAVRDLAES